MAEAHQSFCGGAC